MITRSRRPVYGDLSRVPTRLQISQHTPYTAPVVTSHHIAFATPVMSARNPATSADAPIDTRESVFVNVVA